MSMTTRLATADDIAVLAPLMAAAIEVLQKGFIDEEQIESSKTITGIDRQLIEDGTYFVVEIDGTVAGCGGRSRRATLYSGDHSAGRDAARLTQATDPVRVRAMYPHPDFARRGVGRLLLETCATAAAAEGFTAHVRVCPDLHGATEVSPPARTDRVDTSGKCGDCHMAGCRTVLCVRRPHGDAAGRWRERQPWRR